MEKIEKSWAFKALEEVTSDICYKTSGDLQQIYITTDNGKGESYGTNLTKSKGYVSSRISVTDVDGNTIVDDCKAEI